MARKMISVEVDAYIDFEYTPVRDMIKKLTQVVENMKLLVSRTCIFNRTIIAAATTAVTVRRVSLFTVRVKKLMPNIRSVLQLKRL